MRRLNYGVVQDGSMGNDKGRMGLPDALNKGAK